MATASKGGQGHLIVGLLVLVVGGAAACWAVAHMIDNPTRSPVPLALAAVVVFLAVLLGMGFDRAASKWVAFVVTLAVIMPIVLDQGMTIKARTTMAKIGAELPDLPDQAPARGSGH